MRSIVKRMSLVLFAALALGASSAGPASAEFGLSQISVSFTEADGSPTRQAGSHPFAMTTAFHVNTKLSVDKGVQVVDGAIRNLDVILPAGFVGNPTAVPRCETLDFLSEDSNGHPDCADSTALGVLTVRLGGGTGSVGEGTVAVYSLEPPPGSAAKLGFEVAEQPITVSIAPAQTPPYNVVASLRNTSQTVEVLSSELTIWGNPADPAHDPDRGDCAYESFPGTCEAVVPNRPFLTLPRSCDGPLVTTFTALSWWSGDPVHPGPPALFEADAQSPGMLDCSRLGFAPQLTAEPTSHRAESPSGLAVDLAVADEGLANPAGRADSDVDAALLALPEGMTANPSLAEGLATCGPGDLGRETPTSAPGEGCPEASKVGTLEVQTPVLEGTVLHGTLYIATPEDPATPDPGAENPFDSLLALYMVVKDPGLGLLIKQPGLIEPDPRTGQLVTSFEDLPPFPLGQVHLTLREGGRSPLITPPSCGPHTSVADLYPSGDPFEPLTITSSFEIKQGVDGGPCPPPGTRPFAPGLSAGTANNAAASYSPFHLRLTRRDGDQDLTRFDATLPPGVLAKLAGVSRCPDGAIAAAKAKTGRAELASASCPAASRIGSALGGAGVGSQLTYARGSLYLASPVGKAPLSVVGVVPAVAGPFDVGTVVVRQALRVNPVTGVAEVDGSLSDPIPHILAGIPLRVRDIRVDVDRPDFTLNPTDCSPFATAASIWGGGLDVFSRADDSPISRSARFQAANCARLGFRPRLALRLKGGTKRGAHPALTAVYRPRKGDANLESIQTRLPKSAFLEQAHIRTICTRVQFAADACPKGSVYGHVVATTPLLEEPLKGPVYLRSSDNDLPDMVLDLHGLVDVEVSARIDSVRGGIRATFPSAPDAPLTKVVLRMQGAKKGLIVNSTNLCAKRNRATVVLGAQNAKRRAIRPVVVARGCAKPRVR
jgi:hypothetical protein